MTKAFSNSEHGMWKERGLKSIIIIQFNDSSTLFKFKSNKIKNLICINWFGFNCSFVVPPFPWYYLNWIPFVYLHPRNATILQNQKLIKSNSWSLLFDPQLNYITYVFTIPTSIRYLHLPRIPPVVLILKLFPKHRSNYIWLNKLHNPLIGLFD